MICSRSSVLCAAVSAQAANVAKLFPAPLRPSTCKMGCVVVGPLRLGTTPWAKGRGCHVRIWPPPKHQIISGGPPLSKGGGLL
eukprot:gene4717-biopygen1399